MSSQSIFSLLPSVDTLLQHKALVTARVRYGHEPVKLAARSQLAALRTELLSDSDLASTKLKTLTRESISERIVQSALDTLSGEFKPLLRPVFNLTGTVVHTNLGRSRLPDAAIAAMAIAAGDAIDLEFDLRTGSRGDRDSRLEALLCELTGAEAATVVNNNAAAVVLLLNSLAKDKEVLISRGELVEIGGAFRIPEVMVSAGCKLREVGTTNRTHARDFSAGIGDNSALIMKVHASNYEIKGFTSCVPEAELAAIAHAGGIPFVSDLGSGSLVDMSRFSLPPEPTVRETIEAGADLVTFSGDKLLGGPQAGIIVGKAELIAKIKANPLKRALRVDKTILAALLSVLQLYRDPGSLPLRLPLLQDLCRKPEEILALAERVATPLRGKLAEKFAVQVVECKSQIGSGALPLETLPSYALQITAPDKAPDSQITALAARLRELERPVIARLSAGSLLLDMRCLRDELGFVAQLDQLCVD